MYRSSVEGSHRRGRPLGRWEDKMKEYLSGEQARRECMDRESWRTVCHGDAFGGSKASELLIDRFTSI